jgi:hypothetical protein
MLGPRRGRTLHRLAREVDRAGVPGALVDCGVWNGGSTILMAAARAATRGLGVRLVRRAPRTEADRRP